LAIPRSDDNDEFRAMGYVAVYAAYMEETAGQCFQLLRPYDPRNPRGDPWQIGARLDSCLRAIAALPPYWEWVPLAAAFQEAQRLAGERNIAIHSPLYARPGAGNIRIAREPQNANSYITPASIYALAEEILAVHHNLLSAAVRLPRFIRESRQQ
jgi:hypothetical protein